jgi:hypothetical protein
MPNYMYIDSLNLRFGIFFGDTLEETLDTQMCHDTMVENHWIRVILESRSSSRKIERGERKIKGGGEREIKGEGEGERDRLREEKCTLVFSE